MDIINIDTNKIKECGKDMMNLSNELKEQIDGLFDSILNIKKTCWTGKSADEFINLTKQEKLQYVQLNTELYNQGQTLVDAANKFEEKIEKLRR